MKGVYCIYIFHDSALLDVYVHFILHSYCVKGIFSKTYSYQMIVQINLR